MLQIEWYHGDEVGSPCEGEIVRIDTARFVHSAYKQEDFITDERPEIALVGRSNVGKSSLLNRLVGRAKLARISSSPGRTRAVNYFLINERFYLVDLPGYGYAKVSKDERQAWARLMDDYFRRGGDGSWVIQLVDAKVGATPLDVEARQYLSSLGASGEVVATKIDKLARGRRRAQLAAIREDLVLDGVAVIPFSARSGEGTKELWSAIDARLAGRSAP